MKKLLVWLLVCVMAVSAIPCYAASFEVNVDPVTTTAKVGDTVEFVITAQGHDLVALQFELNVPKGLRYVPGSAQMPDDLEGILGIAGSADWTEEMQMFTFYNDVGINIKKGTELVRFSCTVLKEGNYRMALKNCLPFDSDFAEFVPSVNAGALSAGSSQQSVQPTQPEQKPQPSAPTQPVTEPVPQPTTESTEPDETQPPISSVSGVLTMDPTQPTQDAGTQPTVPSTEPSATEATQQITTGLEETMPEQTQEPEATEETQPVTQPEETPDSPTGEKEKSGVRLWQWLPAVVVLVIAAVALFVIMKRKKEA